MRVGCRIGRVVVRAHVGLDFDDSARDESSGGSMDQQFSEQARSNLVRRGLKKGARQQSAGQARCAFQS